MFCWRMNHKVNVEKWSCKDVEELLSKELPQLEEGVIENFFQHKIDSEVFLSLDDEYMQELINQLLVTNTMLMVSLMSAN